jgi:hypothetical protein
VGFEDESREPGAKRLFTGAGICTTRLFEDLQQGVVLPQQTESGQRRVMCPDLTERYQVEILRGSEVIGDVDDDRASAVSSRDVAGDAAVGEAAEMVSSFFVVPRVIIAEALIVDE